MSRPRPTRPAAARSGVGPGPAPMLSRIDRGIGLSQQGEHETARQLFEQLWAELEGGEDHPLLECALAHAMADVQTDARDELRWDLRALHAAHRVDAEQAEEAGIPGGVKTLFPSLHLNLAEGYRALGDLEHARHHLAEAQGMAVHLAEDGYGQMIRRGLARLQDELRP